MAINLDTSYPGKTTVDANNPNGTFKNRTTDVLKDGTPFEKKWASDVWGFLSHFLNLAGIVPSGAEENETNSQYYTAIESLLGRREVDFETKDLITNFASVTTGTATAKRVSLLDSNFIPKYIDNLDVTWNIATPGVLEPGTSEKSSTDYGAWIDSASNLVLAPDIASVATGTTAGKLVDAGETFLTDVIHAGDIAYNLTTKQQTTVSADATLEGQVDVTDNIFTSGDSYKIVKMSPVGLGENRERLCTFFNNSSSDFDDSYYTQIQEKKFYSQANGDFAITSTTPNWITSVSKFVSCQINDWTGKGTWEIRLYFAGDADTTITHAFSLTGLEFEGPTQWPITTKQPGGGTWAVGSTSAGTGNIDTNSGQTHTSWALNHIVGLVKKPTFHN